MNVMDFLDNLRRKPESTRKRIAVVTTLAVFSVIFSVWWTTFNSVGGAKSGSRLSVSEVVSPLGVVANMFTGMKDHASDFVSNLQSKMVYSATQTPVTSDVEETTAASPGDETASERNEMNYPDGFAADTGTLPVETEADTTKNSNQLP